MGSFTLGFLASLAATVAFFTLRKWVWPSLRNRCFYDGIRVDGVWEIQEKRQGKTLTVGKIELRQTGRSIQGNSVRSRTRTGKQSDRKFTYTGWINRDQVTLVFEDQRGRGFDTGTYVFIVQNDGVTMEGMATFHGKRENRIVSEPRTLSKLAI